jgi:hypothetical protein
MRRPTKRQLFIIQNLWGICLVALSFVQPVTALVLILLTVIAALTVVVWTQEDEKIRTRRKRDFGN